MANANSPFGLVPIKHLNGSPWSGKVSTYYATGGTDIFVGDPVVLTGTAAAAGVVISGRDCQGMPAVTAAAAGATLLGVCTSVIPAQATDGIYYASGDYLIEVVDDPNVIFRIQEDGLVSSIVVADIGENADLVYTAGSTTTGVSAVTLDSSSHVTSTATLRILRLSDMGPGKNDISTAGAALQYAVFDVLINEHMFKSTSGI